MNGNSTKIELGLFECFPERLKKRLEDKNMTQKDLAGGASVSEQTISSWIKGKKKPDFETLQAVCNVLDCSIDYLTGHIDKTTHDLQFICDYTGLSEKAVDKLHEEYTRGCRHYTLFGDSASEIIENGEMVEMVDQFRWSINHMEKELKEIYEDLWFDQNKVKDVFEPTDEELEKFINDHPEVALQMETEKKVMLGITLANIMEKVVFDPSDALPFK